MIASGPLFDDIDGMASVINAPANLLPTIGTSDGTGRPHIEIGKGSFEYVVAERGNDVRRMTFLSKDDLLYQVFRDITFTIACDEMKLLETDGRDLRRAIFGKQLDLLGRLSVKWRSTCEQEVSDLLKAYPFRD